MQAAEIILKNGLVCLLILSQFHKKPAPKVSLKGWLLM